MKKAILLSLACLSVSVAVVTVLYVLSDDLIHRHNSFIRQFPPHPLMEGDTIDLKYDSYYIAGGTPHNFYLGNTTGQVHLLALNSSLKDTSDVTLVADEMKSMKFWTIRIKVDSPDFHMADGTIPVVFGGKVNEWKPRRYMYDSSFFVDFEPISRTSLALRSISNLNREYELVKQQADTPHVKINFDVLEKQVDGRFCVDGMLHYNKGKGRLVYIYYYRNQFAVCDTNLNLSYRGRTIDTVSKAVIQIAPVASKNARTLSSPPLIVNKHSCLSGNLLLINSGLLAKNEVRSVFDNSSVIDVYDLQTAEYRFSFYIPEYSGKKMHDFAIFGKKLVVLVDRFVITYNLTSIFSDYQ